MKNTSSPPRIEILESRIAPAAVFINSTTGGYKDVDGDLVTVKFSLPILTTANVTSVLETAQLGIGYQLQEINLTGVTAPVAGIGITVTALKAPHGIGDGRANVGDIVATGINLGAVIVHGDLAAIQAGSGSATRPAIALLDVVSMGLYGGDTQGASPTLTSAIDGALGALNVVGSVSNVDVHVTGAGGIGSINIGGSLIGGAAGNSGCIQTDDGNIGPVTIAGGIIGGAGAASGNISSGGGHNIASVAIGGSLIGASGEFSGSVTSNGSLGSATIGGSIIGGSKNFSGAIIANNAIGPVTVRGSVTGGAGSMSGIVQSQSVGIGTVTVGGSVVGGTGLGRGVACKR